MPMKPIEPSKPQKFLTGQREQVSWDVDGYSLWDLICQAKEFIKNFPDDLNQAEEFLSKLEIEKDMDYDPYGDSSSCVTLIWNGMVENKRYDHQLEAYKNHLDKYEKKMEEYNKKAKEYKKKLKAWEEEEKEKVLKKEKALYLKLKEKFENGEQLQADKALHLKWSSPAILLKEKK